MSFIGWTGDALWGVDELLQRISFFDTAGQFLSSVRLPPLPGDAASHWLQPVGVFRDGSLIATTGWGNELPDEMRIYRVDGAFQEITDAVARFRSGLRALYRFDYPDGFCYSSGPNPFSMVTCGVPRRTAQRFSSWSGSPQWLPRRRATA